MHNTFLYILYKYNTKTDDKWFKWVQENTENKFPLLFLTWTGIQLQDNLVTNKKLSKLDLLKWCTNLL